MAVEIIIGRAGAGKTFHCLQRMKKILSIFSLKSEIYFLLPAYQTYRAELALFKETGGAVNVRMYSFQRFAAQILEEVGGSIIPRISEIGRRLLLRKILLNRAKDLLYYERAAKQRGFVEILAREIQDLRTYSVDAEKLSDAAANIDDEELKNKIHDLAILYEDFRAALSGKQNDESDLLEHAAELIKNSKSISRAEIFIDGFIFFDPQQRKILREIFKCAKNVYVTLPLETDISSRENVKDVGIFNRSFKTFNTLKNLAAEVETDFKIIPCNSAKRFQVDALKFLEENIFARTQKTFAGNVEGLKIFEAVNKRAEVEAVAQDILKLLQKDYRCRQIGIIARDETYSDLIKPIFEIHGIPFFIDGKRPANNHPLAELIRSALEILRGWRAESIFRCLRTGFFNLAQEDIDLLENYVLEFGLRGEKVWTQENNWRWYRHNLESDKISESETARLEKVDAIRRTAVEPLINFSQAFKKKSSAKNLTAALFNFVENLNAYEKLFEWSQIEEMRGNLALSREHLKIWDDIISLFDQVAESLDENSISAKDFESIINEGLDALQMSLIPPGVDEVTVSNFDQNSLQNSRAIYILGFSSNAFPKRAAEKNLLSDADRLHLNDNGLEIPKGTSDAILAEKFLIYRGLTEAKKYLCISYPLADSEGNAMNAAALLDRIKKFFPQIKTEFIQLEILETLGSQIDFAAVEKTLSKTSAEKLFAPNKKLRGSVTNVESFNKCPFQYFVKYGLKLEERREYKVTPPDIGNILHSVMAQFGERLKNENRRWASVENPELEKIVTEILENTAPNLNNKILLSTNALKHQSDRIKKVAINSLQRLIKLDAVSKFHPNFFEETFGDKKTQALIYDIAGVKMELTGKIDRVDFNEDGKFFLIIDYKTGSAYLNLNEIYNGLNIQLLTYLLVAKNLEIVGGRAPAGMMYYFLKAPVKTVESANLAAGEVNKALKFAGWTLDDTKIIKEIDGSEDFEFLKVSLKNDGNLDSRSKKNVKSAENFSIMLNFLEQKIQNTGAQILNGNIEVKPAKTKKSDACKYCIYGELCGFNSDKVSEIVELDDNEILDKMKLGFRGAKD